MNTNKLVPESKYLTASIEIRAARRHTNNFLFRTKSAPHHNVKLRAIHPLFLHSNFSKSTQIFFFISSEHSHVVPREQKREKNARNHASGADFRLHSSGTLLPFSIRYLTTFNNYHFDTHSICRVVRG